MGKNADFRFGKHKFKKPAHGVFIKADFRKGRRKFIQSGNNAAPEGIQVFCFGGFSGKNVFVIKPAQAFGNFAFHKKIIKSIGKFFSACAQNTPFKFFQRRNNFFAQGINAFQSFGIGFSPFGKTFGISGKRREKKPAANVPHKAIVFKFRGFFRRNRDYACFKNTHNIRRGKIAPHGRKCRRNKSRKRMGGKFGVSVHIKGNSGFFKSGGQSVFIAGKASGNNGHFAPAHALFCKLLCHRSNKVRFVIGVRRGYKVYALSGRVFCAALQKVFFQTDYAVGAQVVFFFRKNGRGDFCSGLSGNFFKTAGSALGFGKKSGAAGAVVNRIAAKACFHQRGLFQNFAQHFIFAAGKTGKVIYKNGRFAEKIVFFKNIAGTLYIRKGVNIAFLKHGIIKFKNCGKVRRFFAKGTFFFRKAQQISGRNSRVFKFGIRLHKLFYKRSALYVLFIKFKGISAGRKRRAH